MISVAKRDVIRSNKFVFIEGNKKLRFWRGKYHVIFIVFPLPSTTTMCGVGRGIKDRCVYAFNYEGYRGRGIAAFEGYQIGKNSQGFVMR